MTFDWSITKPSQSNKSNQNIKRNVAIGTGLGILTSALVLTKGKLTTLPKMSYGVKEVMTICAGSSIGGYIGANLSTKDNFKGRTMELKNELLFNDFIPLIILSAVDKLY